MRARIWGYPDRFRLYFLRIVAHNFEHIIEEAHIETNLDQFWTSCRHIGQWPANLFPNRLPVMLKQLIKSLEYTLLNGNSNQIVRSRENVSKSSQTWNCYYHVLMLEELSETWDSLTFNERSDTIVTSFVCHVRKRPSHVLQNLLTIVLDHYFDHRWNSRQQKFKSCWRFSLAEIAKGPRSISDKTDTWGWNHDQIGNRFGCFKFKNSIPILVVVAWDVSQTPNGLFFNFKVRSRVDHL